jgi:hypothetical protein
MTPTFLKLTISAYKLTKYKDKFVRTIVICWQNDVCRKPEIKSVHNNRMWFQTRHPSCIQLVCLHQPACRLSQTYCFWPRGLENAGTLPLCRLCLAFVGVCEVFFSTQNAGIFYFVDILAAMSRYNSGNLRMFRARLRAPAFQFNAEKSSVLFLVAQFYSSW